MKKIISTIFAITILFSFVAPIFAQDDAQDVLADIEDERTRKLQEQLGLTIPVETDNPNHILSFTDPSPEESGIKLEIDGQGFAKVTSPYTLPSLGIGKHTLTFRFTDNEDTVQLLEKALIVIPRPPVINAPDSVTAKEITVSGSALAGSRVELFLSGDTLNSAVTVDVDETGEWTYTFKGEYTNAIYSVVATTHKNGYASTYSEPIVFELTSGTATTGTDSKKTTIQYSFNNLFSTNIKDIYNQAPDLLWTTLILLSFGIAIGYLITKLSSKRKDKGVEKVFQTVINGKKEEEKKEEGKKKGKKKEDTGEKELTLREKFEKAGFKSSDTTEEEEGEKPEDEHPEEKEPTLEQTAEKEETKEPKGKEEESEEKEDGEKKKSKGKKKSSKKLSKEEFKEKFKAEDPDTKDGKETKPKTKTKSKKKKEEKMSKNVKVSLTSEK